MASFDEPPQREPPYQELNRIGRGAYGTVYKARDTKTNRVVALKKIKVPLTEDGVPMNTLREIGVLKQLNTHNNEYIVRLLDVCHGKQSERELVMFLVFEHVDQDLAMYMDKSSRGAGISSVQIRRMSREILSGVDFLHTNRIVHRDLKPQNLLVTHDEHIKIADFGLAKTYDFEMKLTSVVVTLWYRAPEILLNVSYATPVDVWSVGCIIAELFSLCALFCGISEVDQLNKIFKVIGRPPKEEWPEGHTSVKWENLHNHHRIELKQLIPTMCDSAQDLVTNMLTFDPEKRLSAKDALDHTYFTEEPL